MLPNISTDFSEGVRDAQTEASTDRSIHFPRCLDSGLCSPAHSHTRRPGHALFNLRHYSEQSTEKIFGVEKIDVKLDQRRIVVTYDDIRTDIPALVKATTEAGFPSGDRNCCSTSPGIRHRALTQ